MLLYHKGLSMSYTEPWAGLEIQTRPKFFDRIELLPGPNEMAKFRTFFVFSGRNPKPSAHTGAATDRIACRSLPRDGDVVIGKRRSRVGGGRRIGWLVLTTVCASCKKKYFVLNSLGPSGTKTHRFCLLTS